MSNYSSNSTKRFILLSLIVVLIAAASAGPGILAISPKGVAGYVSQSTSEAIYKNLIRA